MRAQGNPIIAALDVPTPDQALALVRELLPVVGAFKIGSELFCSAGPDLVHRVRDFGLPIFLDLKFHDIPNTVARAVASVTKLKVQMLTVHACGGAEMLRAAEAAAAAESDANGLPKPLVLGVTVLTSADATTLAETGIQDSPAPQVLRLARLAVNAGLRGLVCSPLEITLLRQNLPTHIQLVTPGVRPGHDKGDQKRTLAPCEAIKAGANWLVIGRPIYASPNPRGAAEEILNSLA